MHIHRAGGRHRPPAREAAVKVLLVSMPFGALERQALGPSILKACLTRAGVPCDVRYLNFGLAGLVGVHDYVWVTHQLPYTAFAGDWCFTAELYGAQPRREQEYVDRILRGEWKLSELDIRRILRVRSMAGLFLDHCLAAVDWEGYDVVGFTSTFEQNVASLALARRVKRRHPRVQVVFGGANWEGEMGVELHRQFPFVDYVCSGESEESLPALVACIRRRKVPANVAGVVYRSGSASVATGPSRPVEHLDELPVPDYEDYFRDLAACAANADVLPVLLFETARGCWWGAKSHCTFCGLNGGAMAFRAKSQARALAELTGLTRRWGVTMVECVDNILDMRYFQEFLPAVAAGEMGLQLFYEVKANLSRHHVKLLADAGAHRIQPGIESMSDHVLALMRKGTTALQNIQLLKWCREYQVSSEWNLLYGFPGETRDDYQQILDLLPSIRFLGPPSACGPLRLDRFSPYFDHAASYGLHNVRALRSYQFLYPFPPETLRRIAYYFDFDYAPGSDPRGLADDVIRYVQEWQQNREAGTLTATRRTDGRLRLDDTRGTAARPSVVLGGLEQAAYEFCDRAHTLDAIEANLRRRYPGASIEAPHLRAFLESVVANQLMVRLGDKYLSLALAMGELRSVLETAEGARPGRLPVLEAVS
jgi:ribosomal peptide maturation radical SAM protein 1